MKLYISENIDKAIEGFVIIPIIYGEVDLSNIPDNAASEIVAIDALDSITHDKVEQFIGLLCRKLRLNGNLYLGGLDAYAISRSLLSGSVSIKEYNENISKKDSLYSSKIIIDLLKRNNINLASAVYKGNYYEVTAKRTYNQN